MPDTGRMIRRRRGRSLLLGVAAAALYFASVALAAPFPGGRMLYDGLLPQPPYRWVHPPASRRADNEQPQPYTGVLPLGAGGSIAAEFATDDLQATVTLAEGEIPPRAGETKVDVTLTPLDPATLAPPPPGRRFDGNAYRIEAIYASSGTTAPLRGPVTIVLRYAVHASTILRLEKTKDRTTWERLRTTVFTGSQEDLAHSDRLGVFVASSP